jgi:glycosyltransferase involved in cell wall biosynthesis
MQMKLVHVVPHIDQEAAGPSYSVPRQCQSLAACGNEVELTCLAARGEIPDISLDMHPQWPVLGRFAISTSLARALGRKAQVVDIVHNHSLWSMVNVASGWVVPGRRAKLVTSPHGTLSPWALSRSRGVKWVLWPLQRRALARADLLHATSEDELLQIRAQGFTAPVAVVPNGIDVPPMPASRKLESSGIKTLLFLSRIHPTKGIDRLLNAWAQLQAGHPQWRLVIAGRGDASHVQEVQALAAELGVERVEFPGPLYGEAKEQAYFGADLFVLPTHSENFGMVVAEALAHGCPAIVGSGAPWSGLETEACGWWVDISVPTLAAALDSAMQLPPEQLTAMGLRGRAWMLRDYDWAVLGQKMDAAYRWLLYGGECPAWVRTNQ